MKRIGLNELKSIQLSILDDVHEYCKEHHLRYSICGGTLLGAVKHRGYVPMDDDIDIMMPRPDYERFIREYHSDNNFILDLNKSDSCRELFSKVCRKGTRIVDPSLGRSNFSIFIDVCPVDGVPRNKKIYYQQIKKKIDIVPKVCAFYKNVPNNKWFWFLKYIIKRITSGYIHNVLYLKKEIHNTLIKHDFDSSTYACEMIVCYDEKQIINAEIFKKYTEYIFEGHTYMGIENYDAYLTPKYQKYGYYLNLPPLENLVHDYEVYVD